MAKIIPLGQARRKARKDAERAEKDAKSAENRVKYGRTKAEKAHDQARSNDRTQKQRLLDAHKRDSMKNTPKNGKKDR